MVVSVNRTSPSYEDYVRRIPTARRAELEKKLDYNHHGVDKHLVEIAGVLLEWRALIPHLNLTPIDENDILDEHSPSQQRYVATIWPYPLRVSYSMPSRFHVTSSCPSLQILEIIHGILSATRASPKYTCLP